MITDAQTAKWQARYGGRDPTDPGPLAATGVPVAGLPVVNKVVRTDSDIAMRATKLNAQVQLTNLQTTAMDHV
jgi:hypothetical protein